jgi:hypothetical protein
LPLWEDIERKFTEALEGRREASNNFLGAMVLDQKQTPTGHVVIRQVRWPAMANDPSNLLGGLPGFLQGASL